MLPDSLHATAALAVTIGVFVALQLRRGAPTDLLFLLGLVSVTVCGVITPEEAFRGFASPAVLTIGALLVMVAGLRVSGALDWIGRLLLGTVHTERSALTRLAPAMVAASAFLLNTALVAMMAPVVVDWCRRHQISPSRLLLPLSYLAILGGVCTLIGTSTTLVANEHLRVEWLRRTSADDLYAAQASVDANELQRRRAFTETTRTMKLFEIGRVGLPCALVGSLVLVFLASRLLPNRVDMLEQLGEQRREYLLEMLVQPDCPLIGDTIEHAGLRHLPGLFLIEIDREGDTITPVAPQDIVHSGDRLIFTGVVSTIVDLEKIQGLVPAVDMTYEFHPDTRHRRRLTEVVLSRTSPLIGTTVREANFRTLYNAAVVAVHRNGVRLTNKVGSIRLEPGDTLMLQTRDDFVSTHRNNSDFYLVSSVEGDDGRRHHKLTLAVTLVLAMLAWLVAGSLGWLPESLAAPSLAAVAMASLMIVVGCMRVSEARDAIDLRILITIAAALGLGFSLEKSGAAEDIATFLINGIGSNPFVLLVVVYFVALLFTETISNNAVAAMLLPLAIAVAEVGGYSARPFIMAIALAASLSFVTPIGYQTNLMVMGPGGYRPLDYLKCGGPLAISLAATALILIPRAWSFALPPVP